MERIPIKIINTYKEQELKGYNILYLDGHIGGFWKKKKDAKKSLKNQIKSRSWEHIDPHA